MDCAEWQKTREREVSDGGQYPTPCPSKCRVLPGGKVATDDPGANIQKIAAGTTRRSGGLAFHSRTVRNDGRNLKVALTEQDRINKLEVRQQERGKREKGSID